MIGSRARLLSLAAGALLLSACDGILGGGGSPSLTIKLTDAPGDFLEAQVKIERIYLQGEGEQGRETLFEGGDEYIDLLTLAGGKTVDLVDEAAVPAGRYSELRFVICDAFIRTKDNKVYATANAELPSGVTRDGELRAPSFCESGLKVKLPGGAIELEEETRVMVVDFDVSQSFGKQAGQSGSWVMHPVIHATDFRFSGAIAGTVSLAEGVALAACGGETFGAGEGQVALVSKFVPRVQEGETFRSGLTEATGAYRISYVTPGTYAPTYAQEISYSNGETLTFAATASQSSVAVEAGRTASVDYTVTAASCAAAPAS